MEPGALSAAGGRVAGTAISRLIGGARFRLGGREERRAVYGRYIDCLVTVEFALGFTAPRGMRRGTEEEIRAAWIEYERAYAELQLVGNFGPVRRASEHHVYSVRRMFTMLLAPSASGEADMVRKNWEQTRPRLVQEIRQDLLYLPKPGQVWRPIWWTTRHAARRQRKQTLAMILRPEGYENSLGRWTPLWILEREFYRLQAATAASVRANLR